MLQLLWGFLIGLFAGILADSEAVKYWLIGKIFYRAFRRKRLIKVEPYLSNLFRCQSDGGLVAINGVSVRNQIPFVDLKECRIQIGHLGLTNVPWKNKYNKPLSAHSPGKKINLFEGTVGDLLDRYADRVYTYTQGPKAKISISSGVSREAEVLVEIRQKADLGNTPLSEIFSSGHGDYRLVHSEPFEGASSFKPVSLDPGWEGVLRIVSEKFGLIEAFNIKIPEHPDTRVSWGAKREVPEEFQDSWGYLSKIRIE